jgi:adenosylcobinamide-phosphate synthase
MFCSGSPLQLILTLCIALGIDAMLGDPPNRWHPVARMGSAIAMARRYAWESRMGAFLFGTMVSVGGMLVLFFFGLLFVAILDRTTWWISAVVQAMALKTMFSASSLAKAGERVARCLDANDLASARHEVSYHLVSRDTKDLDGPRVAAAALESIAENSSDSVIAPLFYFAIAGLPGAVVYRFANTLDAMWGYRTPALEWLGKSPARVDDLMNWIPARITACLILLVGGSVHRSFGRGVRVWWRDCWKTPSPNSGHPMSAATGVLGVELEKRECYVLGRGLSEASANSIRQGVQLLWWISILWVGIESLAILLIMRLGWFS